MVDSRFFYYPLFQDDSGISVARKLNDIMINYNVTAYHGKEDEKIYDSNGDLYPLKSLQGPVLWRMAIIRICDDILARKKQLLPHEILIDVENPQSEFRENIDLLGEVREGIDCSGCKFEEHNLRICYRFDSELKENEVCIKSSEDGENIVFNRGVFALFVYRSYISSAFQLRKLKFNKDDPKLYDIGKEYDFPNGNVGHSLIIDKLTIEYSFKDMLNRKNMLTQETLRKLLEEFRSPKDI